MNGVMVACGLTLLIAVPPLRAQAQPSDSALIHETSRRFSEAYVRGDAAAMTGLYTSDANHLPRALPWSLRDQRRAGRQGLGAGAGQIRDRVAKGAARLAYAARHVEYGSGAEVLMPACTLRVLRVVVAITLGEIVGTVALAAGLFVRPLALYFAAELAMGILLVHRHDGWFVVGGGRNGMEYSVLLIAVLLFAGMGDPRAARVGEMSVSPAGACRAAIHSLGEVRAGRRGLVRSRATSICLADFAYPGARWVA